MIKRLRNDPSGHGIPAKADPHAPAILSERGKGQRTVTVASKLPMSLDLQLCEEREARVTGQFGSITEKHFVKVGRVYTIRGTSYPVGQAPKGFPRRPDMSNGDEESGYALTFGVPADFMEAWIEQNKDTPLVQNEIIKVHASRDDLEDECAELTKENVLGCGLGPVNADGDPRAPRPLMKDVGAIETADVGPRN